MVREFNEGEYEPSNNYPNGAERAANVSTAMDDEFRSDLFSNDIVDCLAFLDSLVKR